MEGLAIKAVANSRSSLRGYRFFASGGSRLSQILESLQGADTARNATAFVCSLQAIFLAVARLFIIVFQAI